MNRDLEDALIQSAMMHYKAFQKFMELTGGQIGLSLQLASSFTAGILQAGRSGEKEKEEKIWNMMDGGVGIVS